MAVDHQKMDMDIDNKGNVTFLQTCVHFIRKALSYVPQFKHFCAFSWLKKVKNSRKESQ